MNAVDVSNGVFTDLASLTRLRAPVSALTRKPNQRSNGVLPGETSSRQRGAGKTFEEIRPYLPGDDIRLIDWRVSARSGKTQLRVFAADREKPLHIVTDQRSGMFFGAQGLFKSVAAARCAAIAAWQHVEMGEPVGGHVITNTHALHQSARRSSSGALRYLRVLTDANARCNEQGTRMSWSDALARAAPNVRSGAHLIIISDWQEIDEQCTATIRRLAQRQPVTLVQIIEPLEFEMNVSGALGINHSDGDKSGNGVERFKLIASRAFRRHYANRAQQKQREMEAIIAQCRVGFIKIRTTDDMDTVVSQMLNYG